MDGIILLNKPINWSSRDACNKVSKILNVKKTGHSGTLDPFASGLMFVAVNKATKFLTYIYDEPKTYIATLKLGIKTNTGDLCGEVIETKEIGEISNFIITSKLNDLINITEQIPPMTSAVHFNGQKLYKLAHQGITVDRPSRKIKVFSAELISFSDDIIEFKIQVSKGTYIRTLGETLAESLGTVGHLIALKRIAIGPINIEQALELDDVSETKLLNPSDFINLKKVEISEEQKNDVFCGKKIVIENQTDNLVALLFKNNAIAIYERENNDIFKCVRGLW